MATEEHNPETLVFDVNETLLDLRALAPMFREQLGDATLVKEWFSLMLLYSQTVTLAGPYADFGKLARAALETTARMHGSELSSEGGNAILSAMRSVPAHEDVQPALTKLRDRGFQLAALTNSTQSTVDEQLKAAGLHALFEKVLSVERWKRFKPDPEVYRSAAQELGVSPGQMRMIAAHPWDVMGARAAGCKVAFVERTRGAWFPLTEAPEMRGASLAELAEQLISKAAPSTRGLER